VSLRTFVIAGLLLLAAALGVWAALAPPPSAEPAAVRSTPREADSRAELRGTSRRDRPVDARDAAGGERQDAQRQSVAVLVRGSDGKPVSGATVSAGWVVLPGGRLSPGETTEPATTDAGGSAKLSVAELPFAYLASKEGEVGIGIQWWDDGDPVPVTLVPAAAAEVEVVDPWGRAVPDAAVSALVAWNSHASLLEYVRTRDGGVVVASVLVGWSARTDASGCARFALLPPAGWEPSDDVLGGWYDRLVLVEAEGFRSTHAALADGPNRIVLTPAVEYRACVVDEYGRGICGPAWTSGHARGRGDEDGSVVALVPDAGGDADLPPLVLDANGYLPRTITSGARAPAVVDLGTVVLRSAVLLRGIVCHADGTPVAGALVTADLESADRVFVQGLTAGDGSFALEPPSEGAYRVTADAPVASQRGSTGSSYWEAVVEHVLPGEEHRLVLRLVSDPPTPSSGAR